MSELAFPLLNSFILLAPLAYLYLEHRMNATS
jgi:hypothetical protein